MSSWKSLLGVILTFFGSDGADPIDANRQSDPRDPVTGEFVTGDPLDDDPARYTFEPWFRTRFDHHEARTDSALFFGPGRLARIADRPPAALRDRANPFRGRAAPVLEGAAVRTRFFEGDPDRRLASNGGTIVPENPLEPTPNLAPVYLPRLETTPDVDRNGTPYTELVRSLLAVPIPPDQVARQQQILDELFASEALDDPDNPGHPLPALTESPVTQTDGPFDVFKVFAVIARAEDAMGNPLNLPNRMLNQSYYVEIPSSVDPDSLVGTPLEASDGTPSSRVIASITREIPEFESLVPNLVGKENKGFGGDFSGIAPIFAGADGAEHFPNGPACAADARSSIADAFRCPDGVDPRGRSVATQDVIDGIQVAVGRIPLRNISITGGAGELPLRPAPDLSHIAANPGLRDAQGLYIPPPAFRTGSGKRSKRGGRTGFTFERNVDLATGRPLVTRFAGRTPGRQGDGDCDTPSAGLFPVEIVDGATPVPLPFDAPKNWRSSSPLGIGTETPCLKAGGAAGFPAENAVGGAQNALENHHANQQLFATLCSATLGGIHLDASRCPLDLFGGTNLVERENARFPLVELTTILLSGEPVAQAFVIMITNSVRSAKDELGGPAPMVALNRDRGPLCDPDTGAPFSIAADCVAALQAGGWDGIITARSDLINAPNPNAPTVAFFNRATGMLETLDCSAGMGRRGANDGPCRVLSFHYDPGGSGVPSFGGADFLTLDSTLSNEQKGLYGCGPLFGTRCDSADAVARFDAATGVEEDVPLIPAGGGIDLLNTDGGAFFQAWARAGRKRSTPRLRAAFETAEMERVTSLIPECRDSAPVGLPRFCKIFRPTVDVGGANPVPRRFLDSLEPASLTTGTSVIQPQTFRLGEYSDAFGTVQSAGSSFPKKHPCNVLDEGDGRIDIVPGCRGIRSLDATMDAAGIPILFTVILDEGFSPSEDGCPFGGSGGALDIGGVPVDARASDGSPVSGRLATELAACADDRTLAENSNSRVPDFNGIPTRIGLAVAGAQALFHPLAGCLPDEDAASLDLRRNTCPFGLRLGETPRDFAAELAGTDPSGRGPENVFLFRSEAAALSYNAQTFLVWSSCNGDSEQEILASAQCFDPEDSFSPQRCSFAAPQLCENVRGFSAFSQVVRKKAKKKDKRLGRDGLSRRVFVWHTGSDEFDRHDDD